MEHRIGAHRETLGDKYIFGAAIGGIAGKFAERTFRFADIGQDFTFDDNFGAGRYLQAGIVAIYNSVRFAE